MKARLSRQSVMLMAAGAVTAILTGLVAMQLFKSPSAAPEKTLATPQEPAAASLPPSLDCAFHNFTRTAAVVSFYFDVTLAKGEAPRFFERAIVSSEGKRTNFDGDRRPVWTYGLDGDGKPTITSSDGATRIVLYGLQLGTPGVLLVEAGIRSNVYRNLGGECRQTNLGGGAQ